VRSSKFVQYFTCTRKKELHTKLWLKIQNGRDQLKYLGRDVRIILKYIRY